MNICNLQQLDKLRLGCILLLWMNYTPVYRLKIVMSFEFVVKRVGG